MGAQRKLNVNRLIELCHQRRPDGKPYTQAEMAEQLGVSRVAVSKQMAKMSPALLTKRSVTKYREDRADILSELQQTLIRHIKPNKIEKASLSQIITCLAILYDKERLERNQATDNVAVAIKVENLDPKLEAKMRDIISEMTTKKIEKSQKVELADNF